MSRHGMGRGVLRPATAAAHLTVPLHPPAAALAPYVEYYWNPRWDLRGRPDHVQDVLAHPNVHLVFEEPVPLVYGVQRALYRRVLHGRGQAFGVRFRAGAFRPFARGPVAELVDRSVPAAEYFGAEAQALGREVLAMEDLDAMSAAVDRFLLGFLPAVPDPRVARAGALVERLTADPGTLRVDAVARESGLPVRRLQRLFAEYVGASPKWVLRRARLHEAAARADEGTRLDWPALAAELGYADQSHFIRDFTAATGVPPTHYAGR
ncbi:AraC family transcriptional regulator [Streptomyces sp. NBC_00448]|uniref:AraC family transcriptional regulator n=1 Tax=Streptomyces sp. NBC_00448 TaxID=2903652 RepID=UPI002E2193FF